MRNIVLLSFFIVAAFTGVGHASAKELSSTIGFSMAVPLTMAPVTFCETGIKPNFLAYGERRCPDGVQSVTPEAYIQALCKDSVLTDLSLVGTYSHVMVGVRFQIPEQGCEP